MSIQKWSTLVVLSLSVFGVCAGQRQPSAYGGTKGGRAIIFDDLGRPIGGGAEVFWQGMPGKLYTVEFSATDSSATTVVVQFQGEIDWKMIGGTITHTSSDFAAKNAKTGKSGDKWVPVKSFSVGKNSIAIILENGENFRLHDFDMNFKGRVERIVDSTKAK